jgi:hypothetical protein
MASSSCVGVGKRSQNKMNFSYTPFRREATGPFHAIHGNYKCEFPDGLNIIKYAALERIT